MYKYNPDSYLLYGTSKSPRPSFPIRIRVVMNEAVRGAVLNSAAQRAIRRYPYFAVRVEVDSTGSYVLQPNEQPVVVCPTQKKNPALGSAEANGQLCFIDYVGCDIFFNIHHSLTGAAGMLEWIKTTLYEYVCEAYGVKPDSEGIRLADSPLLPGETAYPDAASLPDVKITLPFADREAHYFHKDYVIGALCPFYTPQYYTFDIEQEALLSYAREHGGTPASVLAVLMMQATDMVLPQKAATIVAGITHNFCDDLGCPNSYRDLVKLLYVPYTRDMASWSMDALSAFTRKTMAEQRTPENAAAELRRVVADYEVTDTLPTLADKRKYNMTHARYVSQPRATFNISYVGHQQWGGLEPYVRAAYTLAEGHFLLEVLNVGQLFCVSFFLVTPGHKYIRSFRQALDAEHIPYTLNGPFKKHLPGVVLPNQ